LHGCHDFRSKIAVPLCGASPLSCHPLAKQGGAGNIIATGAQEHHEAGKPAIPA